MITFIGIIDRDYVGGKKHLLTGSKNFPAPDTQHISPLGVDLFNQSLLTPIEAEALTRHVVCCQACRLLMADQPRSVEWLAQRIHADFSETCIC